MTKILLICKEPAFAEDLKQQLLTQEDWEVAEEYEAETVFDVAIVDEDMAQAQDLHQKLLQTPLFLLLPSTAEIPETEEIGNIRIISKPFWLADLFDEMQSAINVAPMGDVLEINGYELNWNTKEIINHADSQAVKLTEREVAILKYLYKTKGKTVSKSELLAEVWGYNPEATTHTVETHIYRLRQKIEQESNTQIILTEENGYRLNLD